jgi:hypothetical protein
MKFDRKKIDVDYIPSPVRHKWGDDVLDEGFVPYPKRLLRTARLVFRGKLRLTQLSAFLAIIDFKRENQSRYPSLDYLAHLAGISRSRFRLCLKKFEKRGWVKVKGNEAAINVDCGPLIEKICEVSDNEDAQPQSERSKKKRK